MDDETAEIELVRPCRRQPHLFLDMATLVGTEPEQNTADISENDLCAIIAFPRLLSYHLPSAILTSFDGRLVKLEKSILPLYTSTQILTKRGTSMSRTPCLVPISDELPDIESALQKIDEVASNQEGIAAEEALVLRGYVFSHVQHSHKL